MDHQTHDNDTILIYNRKWILGKIEFCKRWYRGNSNLNLRLIFEWLKWFFERRRRDPYLILSPRENTVSDQPRPSTPETFENETFWGNRVEREIEDEVVMKSLYTYIIYMLYHFYRNITWTSGLCVCRRDCLYSVLNPQREQFILIFSNTKWHGFV